MTTPDSDQAGSKGRPTPSRKAAEAARKHPLVPKDRKSARRQDRAAQRAQRDREYQALQTGDEKNLPFKDRGPERRWIRDYVDARRNVGEWFLPFSLVAVAAMLFSGGSVELSLIVLAALYLGVGIAVVDAILLGRRLKARAEAKFGVSRLPRGYRMYGVSRAFQIRRMRLPKPQVGRGQYPS